MPTAIAVWYVFLLTITRVLALNSHSRSLVVNPGTKETVVPPSDIQIHVKGLSLGADLKDNDGRSSLKLSYEFVAPPTEDDDEEEEEEDEDEPHTVTKEIILGSLTPGKVNYVCPYFGGDITLLSPLQIEQAPVDIILDEEDEYVFEVVGKK